jgi:cation transport ATPase
MKTSTAQTAKVIRDDGSEELIDAGGVKDDDILLVEPNEQIVADGIIVSGNAQIDESIFSGINIPVEKKVGDKVYARTMNLTNSFTIMVCNIGEKTEFSKIVRMVENLQMEKTQTRKFSEKFLMIFSFAVLAAILANVLINIYLSKSLTEILTLSASILVVSCPCAFWLASSGAAAAGTQIGMKYEMFFKFAEAFNIWSKVKNLVLAKPKTFNETLPKAVEELQKLGISVYMITHENKISVKKVEKLTGISAKSLSAGLNFADKADFVKKIMTQQAGAVATVGNGLNDAAALSQADLGISIAGDNKVSLDVSGVVLKNDDFLNLCYGIKISQKTAKIRKQNLFFAFFFNVVGISLVIMKVFSPAAIASLTMVISCACVAVNSLRIKKLKFNERK